MLAKKYRLPVQTAVGKKGKETHFPDFLIKIFPNSLTHPRFGVILKKGVVKKAVDRNRIRRTVFDAIRNSENFAALPNLDVMIIAGKPVVQMKKEILISRIQSAISAIIN